MILYMSNPKPKRSSSPPARSAPIPAESVEFRSIHLMRENDGEIAEFIVRAIQNAGPRIEAEIDALALRSPSHPTHGSPVAFAMQLVAVLRELGVRSIVFHGFKLGAAFQPISFEGRER